MQNLIDLSRKLAKGALTSRTLVEACLARRAEPRDDAAGARHEAQAARLRSAAARIDAARAAGREVPRFSGIPLALSRRAPLRRLAAAGFLFLNGEPDDGAAFASTARAVARGEAAAGLDFGFAGASLGEAAAAGLVAFAPQDGDNASATGEQPASAIIATSVSCCAVLASLLAGGDGDDEDSHPLLGLRLGVLDAPVPGGRDDDAPATRSALARLSQGGARLLPLTAPEFAPFLAGGAADLVAAAARRALDARWSAADLIDAFGARARFAEALDRRARPFDAILVCGAPHVVALIGRPALALPGAPPGAPPASLALLGERGRARRLLSIARGLEGTARGR